MVEVQHLVSGGFAEGKKDRICLKVQVAASKACMKIPFH